MDSKKIKKIKKRIQELYRQPGNINFRQLERIAKAIGRKKTNRGKHPTYESILLPGRTAITIPNHPGSLAMGTALNILDEFEKDLFEIESLRLGGQEND